ncbi:MAG: glycosyltransferase family 9 protein [Chloroflexi bacterium]|nr:glycosyltransferase family 9 protein [Chloroflexota bacterium]
MHGLRQKYPTAHISAIVFPTNKGILEDNPDLDELLVHLTWEQRRHPFELARLFWSIRQRRFDLAVDFSTFSFFLSRVVAGAPRRVKLQLPDFWWLVSHRETWGRTHALFHYLRAIEPLGIEVDDPQLHLNLTPADRAFAQRYLAERGVREDETVIAVHPGGEGWYGKKRWNKDGFAQVGNDLVRKLDAKVLILGGGNESSLAREVAGSMTHNCLNGAGQTSLKQTAALIERCRLFVGNDSSPLHMAAAVKTPVVGIYGPSNTHNFHPFGVPHVIVHKEVPCAPCFHFLGSTAFWQRSFCRRCRALDAIQVADVIEAAEALLGRT